MTGSALALTHVKITAVVRKNLRRAFIGLLLMIGFEKVNCVFATNLYQKGSRKSERLVLS
jgi:hypothetical protein